MSDKDSTKYEQKLLTRSRPGFPTQPTANNIQKWRQALALHEERGLRLLFNHYRSSISMLGSPVDQMRDLALALARDHVPFFSSKRPKSSKWNIHEHAKFLINVQSELKKQKDLAAALRYAGNRLPKHLRLTQTAESLKRRYYLAQKDLSGLVSVNLSGDIQPHGELQGRFFKSFLNDDYYDIGKVRFEPCPDDPDAEIVSGLSIDETPFQGLHAPLSEE
nr:hypothetical protein [uncultured bacterium]